MDDLTNPEAHKHLSVTNSLVAPYLSEKRTKIGCSFKIRPECVKRLLDTDNGQRRQCLGSGREKIFFEKRYPCSSLLLELSFP